MPIIPADILPTGNANLTAYIVMMFVGFLVGIAGHIIKSNTLIATGIGLIFMAILVLPLLFHVL